MRWSLFAIAVALILPTVTAGNSVSVSAGPIPLVPGSSAFNLPSDWLPRTWVLKAQPVPGSRFQLMTDWNATPLEVQQNDPTLILPAPTGRVRSRMPVVVPDPNTSYAMPMIDPTGRGKELPDLASPDRDDTHP